MTAVVSASEPIIAKPQNFVVGVQRKYAVLAAAVVVGVEISVMLMVRNAMVMPCALCPSTNSIKPFSIYTPTK